jgi:HPt (histidine-containing phosphotransfer) domain-containing protein
VGVSAHASGGDRTQALAAGMDAFLTKPVELSLLAATLVAGEAPKLSASRHERLRAQFAARFRSEVAAESAVLRDALERRDWAELRRRAHHLKSSAGVVGDERLYAACGRIEDAVESRDATAADAAWAECETALAPWLTPPSPA